MSFGVPPLAGALQDQVVLYLRRTPDCWWTPRGIGLVFHRAVAEIDDALQACWEEGLLLRKRGLEGRYGYRAQPADRVVYRS